MLDSTSKTEPSVASVLAGGNILNWHLLSNVRRASHIRMLGTDAIDTDALLTRPRPDATKTWDSSCRVPKRRYHPNSTMET